MEHPHLPTRGDSDLAKWEQLAATGALKDQEKRALVDHARWNRRGGMVSSRSAERWRPSRSRRRRQATGSSPPTAGSRRPAAPIGADSRSPISEIICPSAKRRRANGAPAPAYTRRFRSSEMGAAGGHWRTEGSREKGAR